MTTEGSDLGSFFLTICHVLSVMFELLGCDCHPLALFDFLFCGLRDDTMSFPKTSVGVSELNYHINIFPL